MLGKADRQRQIGRNVGHREFGDQGEQGYVRSSSKPGYYRTESKNRYVRDNSNFRREFDRNRSQSGTRFTGVGKSTQQGERNRSKSQERPKSEKEIRKI